MNSTLNLGLEITQDLSFFLHTSTLLHLASVFSGKGYNHHSFPGQMTCFSCSSVMDTRLDALISAPFPAQCYVTCVEFIINTINRDLENDYRRIQHTIKSLSSKTTRLHRQEQSFYLANHRKTHFTLDRNNIVFPLFQQSATLFTNMRTLVLETHINIDRS